MQASCNRWLLGLVGLTAIVASSPPLSAAEWQQPAIELKRVAKAPVIDGDLSDSVWAEVKAVEFQQFPKGGAPAAGATTARVATDGTWLFAAYEVKDATPEPEPVQPLRFRPDTMIGADHLELFVDPGTQGRKYFQFIVDRFGQQRDQAGSRPFNSMARITGAERGAFTGHWRSAGKLAPGGWTVELAIPLFYFYRENGNPAEWGINFCRRETEPAEWSCWSLTERAFHEPNRFGRVTGVPTEKPKAPFAPVLSGCWAGIMSMVTREWVYPVNVLMRNDSEQADGTVKLTLEDVVYQKGRQKFETTVALKPNELQHLFTTNMANLGAVLPDPVATISLQDELGLWRQGLGNLEGMVEEGPLNAYLDLSYYTREAKARLYYRVNQPEDALAKHSLYVKVQDPAGKTIREETVSKLPGSESFLELAVADWAAGLYPVRVELRDAAGKVVDGAEFELRKLPPLDKGTEVKVDQYNRCALVNDQPFFPFGVCFAASGDLRILRDLGFNTFWRWGGGFDCAENTNISPAQAVQNNYFLKEAEKYGLKVIENLKETRTGYKYWHNHKIMAATFADWVKTDMPAAVGVIKHYPGLLGYFGFDEPAEMNIYPGPRLYSDICAEMLKGYRAQDPYHLTFNNYAGNVPTEAKWKVGQDVYQMYHGSERGRAMAAIDARNSRLAARDHKPLWVMLWLGSSCGQPWPNAVERVRTYTALVHGASAIYYWIWPSLHIDTHRALAQLAHEVKTLAPALLRRRPAQQVNYGGSTPEQAAVNVALLTMPDGAPILILVNQEDFAVDLSCTLPWSKNVGVQGLFDGKAVSVRDGAFSCQMEGLGVRVFAIAGARIEDPEKVCELRIRETPRPELRALPHEELRASRNLVINSSFEVASKLRDWPDGWRPSGYGTFFPAKEPNAAEWRLIGTPNSPWRQDADNPYHGKYSLRMEGGARFAENPYWSHIAFQRVEEGQPYVFSLYMRAATNGQPITVQVSGIGTKTFPVTTTWQRYVVAGTFHEADMKGVRSLTGYSRIQVAFTPHDQSAKRGVVWLDALQLEAGTEPTAYEQDGYNVVP